MIASFKFLAIFFPLTKYIFMPTTMTTGGPGVHHSVGQLLDPLLRLINPNLEKLYLVHRLDKETTGVMLLAKSVLKIHPLFVLQ
jgi:23S rRNA-/tRNA-specific pseudouridylate synthase